MYRKFMILTVLILVIIITISGCTTKNATNGTFGERTVSINNITIYNITADHYEEDNGTNIFFLEGNLKNNNKYDAFHVKMKATAYDADGNIFAVNDSAYLDPPNIASGGQSYFYFEFVDQNHIITRYDLQVTDASPLP